MEVLWTDDFVPFESRHRVFNKIMETLRDENVSVIGICGMGGIGKTTLVKEIGKRAKKEGLFDNVVMTIASQAPNIRRMQGILADMLRLAFKGTCEADRAAELSERLKKERRVLIILDDVWEKLSLADIGMPSTLDHKCCKLVLTTRRVQVCDDMCCQIMFHLNVLDDDEALSLFSKHARITPNGNPQYHSKAKQVVKECRGLPLAIETVGSALRNKSLVDYDDAIRKLSHSAYVDIESVDREIYPAIKLSLDYLTCEETVRCLALFSLYPEDKILNLEDFTRIAFGIGLFENVNSVEEARQNTLRCVTRLLDACLLLPSQGLLLPSEGTLKSWNSFHQQIYEQWNNAFVSSECIPSVRLHDIVRDVALWLSRKKNFFFMQKSPSKKQSKEYENAIAISMKDCGLDCRLKCPQLKLLLVETTSISGLQDDCFETMSALQVLHLRVSCASDTEIFLQSAFPASIQHLQDLRTFLFDIFYSRWCPGNLFSVIGMLKNLQILSLESQHSKELPQAIEELSSLKLLDLSRCSNLEKIPRNVLSSLTALEELYFGSKLEVEKEVFLEITSLPHLTALTARVNFAGILPSVSFRKPLRRYTIYSHEYNTSKCSRNVVLDAVDCSEMASLQQLFPQVEWLHINHLQGTWENLFPRCPQDPLLRIDACDLDCLIDTRRTCHVHSTPLFSNLQRLVLSDMSKMTRLCTGPPPPCWLPNLRKFGIRHYYGSQNIVPHFILIGSKLQFLRVEKCLRLKHIFEFDPQHLQRIKNEMSLLPSPHKLHLTDLHELTAIWKWPHQMEVLDLIKNDSPDDFCNLIPEAMFRSLNSLAELEIFNCEKVEEVFQLIGYNDQKYKEQLSNLCVLQLSELLQLRYIWKGPQQNLHLCKLECIELSGCSKLTSIFTPASATSLRKLRSIKISKCGALESIISAEEDELSTSAASLLMVVSINIPELEEIYILSCHELKSILPVSILAQGLPQLRDISIADCAKLEQVFGDREGTLMSRDEIALNSLNKLELVKLPSLVHFSTMKGCLVFPSLKELKVKWCPLLGKSFRIGQAVDGYVHRKEQVEGQNFVCLKCVEVTDCHEAKELFHFSGTIIDQPMCSWLERLNLQSLTALNQIWGGPIRSVQLLCLRRLGIYECPNLRTIFTSTIAGALKKLEMIEIGDCINLETILVMGELDFSELPFFPALEEINIEGCDKLKSVLPLSVAQELPRLRSLKIENCPILQHVFSADEGQHTDYGNLHEIKLPNLRSLKLAKVPSSVLFTSANLPVRYPNLQDLSFKGIGASEPNHVTLRFLDNKAAEPSTLEGMDASDINDVCQRLADIKISKPRVVLKEFPVLNCLWKSPTNFIKMTCLSHVQVGNCVGLKTLFTQSIAQTLCFLETIIICNCQELEHIIEPSDHHVEGEEQSFSAVTYLKRLREIKVEGCERLKFIFPLSIAQSLPSLMEMSVKGSRRLEQIFSDDERRDCAQDKDKDIELPKLRTLKLEHLFCLSRIIPAGYVISSCLSKLRAVSIRSCGIEEVCGVYQFHCLTHLDIIECPNLRTLFTSTVARALKTLKQIKIQNCQSLDTILAQGEGHSVDEFDLIEPACFSTLRQIEIEGCHKLKSVLPFSAAQKFTKLEKIEIKNCQNLEAILAMSEGHSTEPTCLGTLQEMETEGCHKLKSVIPELRILRLEDLPCLSRIFPASYGLSRLLVAKLHILFIKNCNIEEVVNLREGLSSSSHEPEVLNLEELYLFNLRNLKHIWMGSVNPKHEQGSHSSCASVSRGLLKLRIVEVQECERLTSIFPLSVARQLPSLKKMSVKRAYQLEQLFSDNEREGCAEGKEIEVPELRTLELEDLPCLSHILPAGYVISSLSFSKLRAVFIKDCGIEEVFDCTLECGGLYQGPVFSNLTVLYLCCLPNLISIWKATYPCSFMGFNQLKFLHVEGCEQLTTIFPRDQYFPTLETVHVEGAVNLQSVFDSLFPQWTIWLRVPQLKTVKLSHLPSGLLSNQQSARVSNVSASYIEIAAENNLFDLEGQVDVDVHAALEAYHQVKRRESDDLHHRQHLQLVEHKAQ